MYHKEQFFQVGLLDRALVSSGLLMRPEKDEAKAQARKCEAEAKNFL